MTLSDATGDLGEMRVHADLRLLSDELNRVNAQKTWDESDAKVAAAAAEGFRALIVSLQGSNFELVRSIAQDHFRFPGVESVLNEAFGNCQRRVEQDPRQESALQRSDFPRKDYSTQKFKAFRDQPIIYQVVHLR